MIKEIQIENFKSIKKMTLDLGRINVFIGENGAGKSNILEAIAMAGASAADKLDNEFLASRGIRASASRHMRCAFAGADQSAPIRLGATGSGGGRIDFELSNDNKPYSSWQCEQKDDGLYQALRSSMIASIVSHFVGTAPADIGEDAQVRPVKLAEMMIDSVLPEKVDVSSSRRLIHLAQKNPELRPALRAAMLNADTKDWLSGFLIYSPENTALRLFQEEGQIEPLGIRGEGVLRFLQELQNSSELSSVLDAVRSRLRILGWFKDLSVPRAAASSVGGIEIVDRYLAEEAGSLEQISANEGFLFLLFYFCLFSTDLTPRFFAIDNVDASLNPKLCAHLVKELSELASNNDKQVILTTHNPATLDGLDINDDAQRLFVISRGDEGETKIRRIRHKQGQMVGLKLSAAFIDGHLGGLPNNF